MSTCGRAKLKISCDILSPIQNTHHKTKAMANPRTICLPPKRNSLNISGQSHRETQVRITAENVMAPQKFIIGAVQGENIKNQSVAAINMPVTTPLFSVIITHNQNIPPSTKPKA